MKAVAINFVVVIGLAVAGLLYFKRRTDAGTSETSDETPLPLKIENTLRIGPKSFLHLVQVPGGNHVVVACDTTGIKSMTSLPANFGGLVETEAEDSQDEFDVEEFLRCFHEQPS